MGLTSAGAWFQYIIAQVILQGLTHDICEVYLDDILVFADTEQQLIDNLILIFNRFQSHSITLNPEKCEFGLTEVEFVGHIINENGLTFSVDKLNGIRNFPIPRLQKELKSFLGLANFFRDHVQGHSLMAIPLQNLITGYDRTK